MVAIILYSLSILCWAGGYFAVTRRVTNARRFYMDAHNESAEALIKMAETRVLIGQLRDEINLKKSDVRVCSVCEQKKITLDFEPHDYMCRSCRNGFDND